MAISEISVSKIYILATEPTNKIKDRFWFDTTNNLLKKYDGTSWKPISVSSDDVVVLSSGNKISLTNYLNTQIAALAEGIDSKQDKLEHYTETVNSYGTKKSTIDNESFGVYTNAGIELNSDGIITLNGSQIELTGDITGTAISTSIPASVNAASDNKILSEKAVKTELDKKQNKLRYYSEITENTYSATISVNNINLRGSVAEGDSTTASGNNSHAEGGSTTASGAYSHAEGDNTTASGTYSHAEGSHTTASEDYSHAEGSHTTASGSGSHAEGGSTTASGAYSHAEGNTTKASSNYQHAQGRYNIEDTENKYADIIGNGTLGNRRSNAATVSWDGISWSQTDVRAGGTDQDNATHSLAAKQNSTDTSLNTTDKTIVGAINELLASINANAITSTEQKRITTTSTSAGIQMSTTAKACMVSINPVKTNVGAIYISTSSDTAPTINPLYPDQMPKYKIPDASQVYIWSDVTGDSVDLTIEYYG